MLLKVLGNGSLALAVLYVLGFIYLKTYLAQFGFEIELASLSITNLLLAHRFFAAQDFFVAAGAIQALLLLELGWSEVKRSPWSATFVLIAPILLVLGTYPLAIWTERNTPRGFNVWFLQLFAAYVVGWLSGAGSAAGIRYLIKTRLLSFRYATNVLLVLFVLGVTVFSYRLYAYFVAKDRLSRGDFQTILPLAPNAGPSVPAEGCHVIYVDSLNFFLRCSEQPFVVSRESLGTYTVNPPSSPRE